MNVFELEPGDGTRYEIYISPKFASDDYYIGFRIGNRAFKVFRFIGDKGAFLHPSYVAEKLELEKEPHTAQVMTCVAGNVLERPWAGPHMDLLGVIEATKIHEEVSKWMSR